MVPDVPKAMFSLKSMMMLLEAVTPVASLAGEQLVPTRVGGVPSSSLVMVPVAVLVPREALEALERVTVKVSFDSPAVSPSIGTVKVLLVSPAAKVSVPLEEV